MNILVINGSPKGESSVTLQTVNYLQILCPEHSFDILHAGQRIKALEKDFSQAAAMAEKAELLLFAYPVYTFLAPCQLHRFFELLKEAGISLEGKFASQISTSKHFYDVTAHRYIQDNCQDLGLKYIRGLSADMDDILSEKGQKEAAEFFRYVLWSMEQDSFEPFPLPPAAHVPQPVTLPEETAQDKPGDVVIITDCRPGDESLAAMIGRFREKLPLKTRVINLWDYPFQGGCLGCFGCAVSGKCVWKDGFDDYLRQNIQTAQSIVYAFAVKDHSMGARFKMYDDRQFCNGHRTVTMGMPLGYLVSGPYQREQNLQTVLEARAQVGGNFLAGVATDEQDPDAQIDRLARTLAYALQTRYVPPQNFFGVGGMKVFRDLIWLMQGMMRADHKFYKAHGQYDFPQKKWSTMLKMYAVGALLANEKIKAKLGGKMTEGMLMPYNKALEKARAKQRHTKNG